MTGRKAPRFANRSVWQDETFRALTSQAQWLYVALGSQQKTRRGNEFSAQRLAGLARGMTTDHVREAAAELAESGWAIWSSKVILGVEQWWLAPTRRPRPPERTALYRYWDADGNLLYVGITNNPTVRHYQHVSKPWRSSAVRRDIEWYETRGEALAAEARAIRAESPLHNIALAVN